MKSFLLNVDDALFIALTDAAKAAGISRTKLVTEVLSDKFSVASKRKLTKPMERTAQTTFATAVRQIFLPTDVLQLFNYTRSRTKKKEQVLTALRAGRAKIATNPDLVNGYHYKKDWMRISVTIPAATMNQCARSSVLLRKTIGDYLSLAIIHGVQL